MWGKSDVPPALAAGAPALADLAGAAGTAAGAEFAALAAGLWELELAVLMEKIFHQKKVKQKQDSNLCKSTN